MMRLHKPISDDIPCRYYIYTCLLVWHLLLLLIHHPYDMHNVPRAAAKAFRTSMYSQNCSPFSSCIVVVVVTPLGGYCTISIHSRMQLKVGDCDCIRLDSQTGELLILSEQSRDCPLPVCLHYCTSHVSDNREGHPPLITLPQLNKHPHHGYESRLDEEERYEERTVESSLCYWESPSEDPTPASSSCSRTIQLLL